MQLVDNIRINKIKKMLCIILMALAIMSISNGILKGVNAGIDFQWDSAKVLALRENPYLASDINNGSKYYDKFADIYGVLEANQFPSLLWLLLPYTFLSPEVARTVWVISNVVFLIGTVFLLQKILWGKEKKIDVIMLSLLFIAATPIRKQIFLGQHTLFAFFSFMVAWYLLENKHENLSGIALAISYFKYSLTAPFMLIFLMKRKYKPVIISGIIHIVLTIFSAYWLNENLIVLMFQPLKQAAWLAGEGFADLSALLGRVGIGGSVPNILTVLIFGSLFIWSLFRKREFRIYDFIFLVYISLIFMYHRRYDYFVMIIPMWYFMYCCDVKYLNNLSLGKIAVWGGRVTTAFQVVSLFIVDAFLDPMTGIGIRLNQYIPGYNETYDIYCNLIIISFYISLVCLLLVPQCALKKEECQID